MTKVKYTEWIDQYMQGELDQEGCMRFENELKINSQLATELRLENDLDRALSDNEMLDFMAICQEAQEEVKLIHSKGARVVQMVRKYWYAAASVLLIAIVAGSIFLARPGSYSNEKLFKMYYKSGEIDMKRSANANMVEALMAYSQKDFVGAAKAFDQILSTDPENIPVKYYCGISNIETGNYSRAITLFKDIIRQNDNSYIEYAEWNLGLTYLANNQHDQAIEQFKEILANKDHSYYEQAKSILQKMEEKNKNEKLFNNLFFLILPF
jgi:cytochrome c-type biogenesis protein CcmH/NrfG